MIETHFASAERSPETVILEQYRLFTREPVLETFLGKVDQYILVLNKNRQIVFANSSLLKDFKIDNIEAALGKRVGELLNCRFAWHVAGCSTSDFCRECGAAQSMLKSIENRSDEFMECVILTKDSKTLELGVASKHMEIEGESFTMFTFADISPEKHMKALEDIFFHDISGIAGGIHSMVQLLSDDRLTDKKKIQAQLEKCSSELLDELYSHKLLKAAERKDLQVRPGLFNSLALIDNSVRFVERLQAAKGIILYIHHSSEDFDITVDANLLNRVLVNMLTNAIEASSFSQKVTIGTEIKNGEKIFWVHNSTYMPPAVQAKIFRSKFSTKKRNSGYGTHSIRIITEGYLNGRVDFESGEKTGTFFRVYLK